jgi:glycerate-2-kinase
MFKNRQELATTDLRRHALDIIEAGIRRVLPSKVMESALRYDDAERVLRVARDSYSLSGVRIFVIGGGKASGTMAEALENIIPQERIVGGVANCKGGKYSTTKVEIRLAGHPIPDQRGVEGVKRMLALKEEYHISERDLVICLLSGGGSALMPCPVDGVSLEDKQRVTEMLLGSGAEIGEINAVRKHLSRVKGGWLGHYYSPTTVVSLIISDVVGNDLATIASGPTVADPSTFQDAHKVLDKYGLFARCPKSVVSYLTKGCRGEVPETPKALANCRNYIIGDNRMALKAMYDRAIELGFSPCIVTSEQKGETSAIAVQRAGEILSSKYAGYDALLVGGETTPRLPVNAGKGGRNQHYAVASMLALGNYPGEWLVASIGTDGSDFLADVAGAIVDKDSLGRARAKGLDIKDYLDRFDSYSLLKAIGGSLVVTGETGTNVGDVALYLLG